MADTIIEPDYHVVLPEDVRPHIVVGRRYSVTVSQDGRLILTPTEPHSTGEAVDEILRRTAGLWQGRSDIPDNGVDYVNQLRQGRRLGELSESSDGR